jgi:hypothetical protein
MHKKGRCETLGSKVAARISASFCFGRRNFGNYIMKKMKEKKKEKTTLYFGNLSFY